MVGDFRWIEQNPWNPVAGNSLWTILGHRVRCFILGQPMGRSLSCRTSHTKLSAQLQSDSHELLKQVAPAFAGLTAALDEIRALAKKATEGGGTVGRLMSDPELFENLSDASRRLDLTMRDLQLLIRKIKEEGLGVSF